MSNVFKKARAATAGRVQQKMRTRSLLLQTAAQLLSAGQRPTVTEVADAAAISRRTAYRYFPTSTKLHADAALDTLRPVMEAAIEKSALGESVDDVELRIETLVKQMQRLAVDNEALLRTMIHETVLTSSSRGAERQRGGRRLEWIHSALKPLDNQLERGNYNRLVCSLALCTGIEALLVLRDICGLSVSDATRMSQWMCRTLVRDTLAQAPLAGRTSKKSGRNRGQ